MEGVNRNTRQRGYEARDKEEMLKNCSITLSTWRYKIGTQI
ncbi:hypothetical protein PTHTG4_09370 [Parageobacillus thermoglucosidasius]|nr:hypothetical protein PTHTG4_09370 [Parageobacillus thermoglucosidasius]